MKKSILLLLLLINYISYGQINQIETALEKGNDQLVIELCDSLLKSTKGLEETIQLQKYVNEAYLNLNHYPEYRQGIQITRDLDTNKVRSEIYYYSELANYYHHQKVTDSSVFFANKSMKLLRENRIQADSNLVYSVYSKFANCNRNRGVSQFNTVTPVSMGFVERNKILNSYLDTALVFTRNTYQQTDVYFKKATVYLDVVSKYKKHKNENLEDEIKSCHKAFLTSNNYYKQAINSTNRKAIMANAYALIGLNHYYLDRFEAADNFYKKSLDVNIENDSIIHLYTYINTLKWKGWNLDIWYNKTKNITLLDKSINDYRQNVNYWNTYYNRNLDKNKGKNDGYRTSAISKLSVSLAKKYLITQDSLYLKESFEFSDLIKYTNFSDLKFNIKDVQSILKDDEAFVQNVTSSHPQQELIFIIEKNEVNVILNEDTPYHLSYDHQKFLYQFDDLDLFKGWSNKMYQSKFKKVDSILSLKGITDVTISNSDFNAMLNYDILIGDTLSNNWKEQAYLFHKYNFSYALCVRSFLESRSKKASLPTNLGLTIGDFENDVDLRFSKKLIKGLESNYSSSLAGFFNNLETNNVVALVAHGNSQYTNKEGEIRTSINTTFTVDDIFDKELSNDFVILTTCNSNASQMNHSEGASGNFSKAFRYAGAKSTLTTSWEIDDKSNAFIMERFIDYLAGGKQKNDALWAAKKDYWNQASQEEYKPLYWAPYILTGNIDPVAIKRKEIFNWSWLWILLIFPLGFILKKKINN